MNVESVVDIFTLHLIIDSNIVLFELLIGQALGIQLCRLHSQCK